MSMCVFLSVSVGLCMSACAYLPMLVGLSTSVCAYLPKYLCGIPCLFVLILRIVSEGPCMSVYA